MLNKANKSRNFTLAVFALVSLVFLGAVFFLFSYLDCMKAEKNMLATMESVKKQYMDFKKSDTESEAKSLMQLQEEMKQVSQRIVQENKELTPQTLRDYADTLSLSGIMVLDEHGEFVAEYASNSKYFDALQKEVMRRPLLEVAQLSKKFYLRRLFFDDGSYIDISAHQRLSAPGIVVCYDHTAADHIDNHNLTLQTLLADYNIEECGTIVIGDGYKVIASNDRKLIGTLTNKNKIIAKLKEDGVRGELLKISAGGQSYYGSLDSGRDFFVYLYSAESQVHATRWAKFGVVFALYLVAAGIWYFRQRGKQKTK